MTMTIALPIAAQEKKFCITHGRPEGENIARLLVRQWQIERERLEARPSARYAFSTPQTKEPTRIGGWYVPSDALCWRLDFERALKDTLRLLSPAELHGLRAWWWSKPDQWDDAWHAPVGRLLDILNEPSRRANLLKPINRTEAEFSEEVEMALSEDGKSSGHPDESTGLVIDHSIEEGTMQAYWQVLELGRLVGVKPGRGYWQRCLAVFRAMKRSIKKGNG